MRKFTRILLIIAGTLSVALGFIGMFIPVLPTTPFLLLAAICYARSSERFYRWLLTNRWCGEYISNYREGRGISLGKKVIALILLWGTIGYSILYVVPQWWVRGLLVVIAVSVTIHLLWIKTFRPLNGKISGDK